jgi:hypothetical protein
MPAIAAVVLRVYTECMAPPRPRPISAAERSARQRRASRIARRLGFEGRVEYRHVSSQTGGAQYGLGVTPADDLLVVYAEAFQRDTDPDDFSLEAIIAHERGHQLVARHPPLIRNLPTAWSEAAEEVVASLLGSILVVNEKDRQDLLLKALFQAEQQGLEPARATALILELRELLEKAL